MAEKKIFDDKEFAVFILTFWRADRVHTVKSLRHHWYTWDIYIICSDDDEQIPQYKERYWDKVMIFNKDEYIDKEDTFEYFRIKNTITHARNACFDIAKKLWLKYFVELDDDYMAFNWRFLSKDHKHLLSRWMHNMDLMFRAMLDFYKATPFKAIAMWQAWDYVWWIWNQLVKWPKRKAMNSFLLSPERRFRFRWTMNEDVNTYTTLSTQWNLFLTVQYATLNQMLTQSNPWWITELYLDRWTYQKTFYTIMTCPSWVKVAKMWHINPRIHHKILWNNVAPCILSEKWKK